LGRFPGNPTPSKYHVTTNDTSHGVWSKPYGVKNASWVDSAVAYKNKKLELKMDMTIGHTNWFAFDDGHGGVFWMDSVAVRGGESELKRIYSTCRLIKYS